MCTNSFTLRAAAEVVQRSGVRRGKGNSPTPLKRKKEKGRKKGERGKRKKKEEERRKNKEK